MEHNCDKQKEKGKIYLSHFDDNRRVCYCHYCGEYVTADEYLSNLESRYKETLERLEVERKSSIELIYENTILGERLKQANNTIRAYEAMENLKQPYARQHMLNVVVAVACLKYYLLRSINTILQLSLH